MASPLSIRIPHQLGRAEARRRIESGFANLIGQVPGGGGGAVSQRWEGDCLSFGVALLGQTVTGSLTVHEAEVAMEIELPGILAMIGGRLREQVRKAGQLLLTKK